MPCPQPARRRDAIDWAESRSRWVLIRWCENRAGTTLPARRCGQLMEFFMQRKCWGGPGRRFGFTQPPGRRVGWVGVRIGTGASSRFLRAENERGWSVGRVASELPDMRRLRMGFYFEPAFLSEERNSTRSIKSCVDMVCCRPTGMREVLSWRRLAMSLFLTRVRMALVSLTVTSSGVSLTMNP